MTCRVANRSRVVPKTELLDTVWGDRFVSESTLTSRIKAARRVVGATLFGEWEAARTLLSAMPDGLLLVHDGRVLSVNSGLCELLGFEREELLGAAAPFPFWRPEHRHEIEAWHALETASWSDFSSED